MSALLVGQVMGLAFASGLNLYLTVAALGLLSRVGLLRELPPGLHGLESLIVIGSAAALFLIEAVLDKVRHVDSFWDTVHTFIRPPAAALLAVGLVWGEPFPVPAIAASLAFMVALVAHGTKAGLRLALNSEMQEGRVWISAAEDIGAIAFATMAFLDPRTALVGTVTALGVMLLLGPRYWRAYRLGLRSLSAWMRTLFLPARWREEDELPSWIRKVLGPTPLGTAPPRGAKAALTGGRRTGAYRNGWLVATADGPVFIYRTLFGHRVVPLPDPLRLHAAEGFWADVVQVDTSDESGYRLFMLKDGPALDLTIAYLHPAAR